jgi:transcription elongation factor GreB
MPSTQKVCITPEGAEGLQAELEQLWKVERPRVTQEVADAAALGDRSENAEYIYGKKRLREIDRRVRFLRNTLEDESGEEHRYRLVGPDEIDVSRGLISVESPMGRVLLGKREDTTR